MHWTNQAPQKPCVNGSQVGMGWTDLA